MEFAGHRFIHYLKVETPRKLERQELPPGDAKHIDTSRAVGSAWQRRLELDMLDIDAGS